MRTGFVSSKAMRAVWDVVSGMCTNLHLGRRIARGCGSRMMRRRGSIISPDSPSVLLTRSSRTNHRRNGGPPALTSSFGCQAIALTSCVCSIKTAMHSKSASGCTILSADILLWTRHLPARDSTHLPRPKQTYLSNSFPTVHHHG